MAVGERRDLGLVRGVVLTGTHGQLRMCGHDVPRLLEGFLCQLPVAADDGLFPPVHPEVLDAVALHELGPRRERLPERAGLGVHVDEGARPPGVDLALHQAQVLGVEQLRVEVPLAVDIGVGAVQVPPPAVERAGDLTAGQPSGALAQLGGPVPARVVERLDRHVPLADHQYRLVADLVLDEVSRLGDLLESARHLPHPGPEPLLLQLEEVPVVVALRGMCRPSRIANGTDPVLLGRSSVKAMAAVPSLRMTAERRRRDRFPLRRDPASKRECARDQRPRR